MYDFDYLVKKDSVNVKREVTNLLLEDMFCGSNARSSKESMLENLMKTIMINFNIILLFVFCLFVWFLLRRLAL